MSNNFTALGRLAKDPELKTVGDSQVLEFRLASDVGFGERKSTNWLNCAIWGKRAESLKEHLSKGSQVVVYGVLTLREWEDKEQNKRLSPDVRVNELSFAGSKPDSEGGEPF